MTDDTAAPPTAKNLSTVVKSEVSREPGDELAELRETVTRYRKALEEIRDLTFDKPNSPRLIDQLWHFVRWSKATARDALDDAGENNNS